MTKQSRHFRFGTSRLLELSLCGLAFLTTLSAEAAPTVKIDGSSTIFPISEAVAEKFQSEKKGAVKVTVGISGTGGGFKKFCRGETDIQDASRPILKDEMAACEKAGISYYELPIAFDAMVVVVSKENNWITSISTDDLKKMWEPSAQGKVTKWNQVRATWPDAPLKLYGAGSDSGTFDYFTEAVMGKSKASRGDYTASEDDNTLVQGISGDKNAIGYLPFAYYEPNQKKLKALMIDGGAKASSKTPVAASKETVENGTYYPLARPIFIYVSAKATERPEVNEFVQFYLSSASKLVEQVKYVALPKEAYSLTKTRFEKKKTGTVFHGEQKVGAKITDLLKAGAAH